MDTDQIKRISDNLRIARDCINVMLAYADRRQHLQRWMKLDNELHYCIVYKLPMRVLEAVVEDFVRICRVELSILQWDKEYHPEPEKQDEA